MGTKKSHGQRGAVITEYIILVSIASFMGSIAISAFSERVNTKFDEISYTIVSPEESALMPEEEDGGGTERDS